MFFFRIRHVAVVLFALLQNFVFASVQTGYRNNGEKALAAMAGSFLQGLSKERIDSFLNDESSCADDLTALTAAAESGEMWALQMVDASSKLQSGILNGNLRDLGMYDQCVGIKGAYNGTEIQGQHCTVSWGIISSAVCVPSSCNETDVIRLVEAVIQNVTQIDGIIGSIIQNLTEIDGPELEINSVSCVPIGSDDFSTGEILTITFFSLVGAFIVFCTICEFVKICRPIGLSPAIHVLAKFSLYTNAMALLSTEVNPRLMPAIQGIRFLSMCWVVLGHRYLNTLSRPLINTLEVVDWNESWVAVYIQTAPFAVDTFFVISGFLMTYLFIKSKNSGKKTNYPMMYVHRYLRLTPCLAVLILFVAVLLHRVSNGPLWNKILVTYVEPCQKNWWVNFLYVQNFVRIQEMCLPHTWYLAVDMQLFWISPFILYPLSRWPKYGLGILYVLLVASIITPGIVLAVNSYTNALINLTGESGDSLYTFLHFYIPTYNRACAYFVGLLLGYDVAMKNRHFSKRTVAVYWIVACIFMLVCGLSTKRIYDTTYDYDVVLETAFAVILRPIWSIAIAWIVYACSFGHGGPVTSLLSLPIFLPLSRLSYCIYLVHMVLQATKIGATQTPGRFADFLIVNSFWGDLILSIVIATIFSLFFESPVVVLEKILTTPRRKPKHSTAPRNHHNGMDGGIYNKGAELP